MSSRGRQPRGAGNNSPLSRSARLGGTAGTATRSTSGSPSSRTRSLAPSLKKSTLTKKMINKNQTKSNSNPAGAGSGNGQNPAAAAPISAKRRSSAEERARFRKGRRPKFQDNPPAPEIVEKKEALQLLEETSRIAQQDEEELTEEMEDSEEEEEVDDDEDAAVQAASNLTTPTNGVHHSSASEEDNKTLSSSANTENGFKRKFETEFEEEEDGKRAKIEIEAPEETEIKTEELLMNGENSSDEIVIGEEEEEALSSINSVTLCKQLKEAVKDLNNSESLKSQLISKLKAILTEHTEVKLDNPEAVFSGMLENQLSMQSDDKAAMVEELVSTYLEHQQIEHPNEDHGDNHELILEDTTTDDDEDNEEIEVPSSELKSEIDSEESESMPPADLLMPQVDGVDSSEKDEQESTTKEDCNNDHKPELNNDNTEECDLNKTVNNHNSNRLPSSNVAADNKSKILSEMENKFAKETQNALKNRPTYRKKSKSETWELTTVHNGSASSKSPNDHSRSMLIKEPGELEVAEMIDEMDDEETLLEDKNDENKPMPMISPSSSSTSASTTKSLRKFRRGNNKYDDHDQDQGPPVITKGTTNPPNTPPKSSRNTMSPPPLTPEMPTPLRIDIPDHYTPSPISSSSFSGGYNRRLVIRTPPAARAGLVTMVSEAVLSKEDAEVAATAVTLSSPKPSSSSHHEDHPSLKIRLPKVGPIPPIPQVIVPMSSSVTPHHKKVPKRRNLHTAAVESDGLDTEEDEDLKVNKVKKKPWLDQDDLTKTDEEMEGGKTTPDSQITTDDRIMVPEKASSFNIHPERTCSDCCFYCRQKFGLFDTPLHISQMKSLDIQKFALEYSNCSKDACLCDKCYRLVERNAKNMKKDSEGGGGNRSRGGGHDISGGASSNSSNNTEKVRSCFVRNCNKEVTHLVGKKWLQRLKKRLVKKLITDWARIDKASMKTSFPVCNKHNNIIEYFSNCGLCKKKLSVNAICCLRMNKVEVQDLNELLRADSIPAGLAETMYVCKLCKTFCGIKQKAAVEPDYLKKHKDFMKQHKRRLYSCLGLDSSAQEDLLTSPESGSGSPPGPSGVGKAQKKIHQVSQSDNPTKITIKTFEVPTNTQETSHDHRHHGGHSKPSRKRRQKEFQSPNSDSRIFVVSHHDKQAEPSEKPVKATVSESTVPSTSSSSSTGKTSHHHTNHSSEASTDSSDSRGLPMCSITISFDHNTQKLWDDLHLPYENYTSFFRHLILLEKYFRNGDLALSENASLKASSYIKSLQNRIEEYEVKHKRSHADLSACTRPDLEIPPAPSLLHLPSPIEPPTTRGRASAERDSSSPGPSNRQQQNDTILRIPKVSMPNHQPDAASPPPSMPTKIRVRSDLQYIGLMANDGKEKNLKQILKDPTVKQKSSSNKGPVLGKTSLVANHANTSTSSVSKSSNSQLFKSSEASGSSAIPLTFNNSIAEVLAAAAKSNKARDSAENTNKPEVTITAKNVNKQQTWSSSSSDSKQDKSTGNAKVNPLMDMSKLLQSQAPGIPPHIIAQNTLPVGSSMSQVSHAGNSISTHQMAGNSLPKIAPKPTSSLLKPSLVASKASTSASTGITSVNKKSLNNVLDRLSGMKSSTTITPTASATSLTAAKSLLTQQLQAPPVLANPGSHSSPTKKPPAAAVSVANLSQNPMASLGLLGMAGFPGASQGSLVGQPMVQYPWTSNPAQQAALEAQRVLSLAGAGLPGMNQNAAAAAMAELMKMSMQQQAQNQNKSNPSNQAPPPRLRAPPPLTHMGRPGSNPAAKPNPNKPE